MKRIGVFVLYDEDGIVDDFIEYLLLKMREVLNKLVIVVNGDLKSTAKIFWGSFLSKKYRI